jgi:hypothetical protein
VSCTFGFVGDSSVAVEVLPGISQGGRFVELRDGDPLPLVTPPQGGHVSFVATRARNVDPCHARISATLRSPRSGQIAQQESRDISLMPTPDGWAEPNLGDISSVANVPLCPDYGVEPIVDAAYALELGLVDTRGASLGGTVVRTVVPSCLQTDPFDNALCRCECKANYMLGGCANPFEAGSAR